MLKEATIYRVAGLPSLHEFLAASLAAETFAPTGRTQQKSTGWEPPRAAHGAMVESFGGHWIARFTTEVRTVPADALQEKTDEMVRKVEDASGRKVGKRERRDLKDEALQALLPQSFPRQSSVPVWIDRRAGLLVIGTASQGKADDIVTSLLRATHTPQPVWAKPVEAHLQISQIKTRTDPTPAMAEWLLDGEDLPTAFTLGRECELHGSGDGAPVLRLNRYDLDSDKVRGHVRQGLLPTRLGLSWQGVASFVLTDTLTLRRIEIADVTPPGEADQDAFDADIALTTGTLGPMLADLIAALGGEAPQEGEAPADTPIAELL